MLSVWKNWVLEREAHKVSVEFDSPFFQEVVDLFVVGVSRKVDHSELDLVLLPLEFALF
jgi:hypothetical protein